MGENEELAQRQASRRPGEFRRLVDDLRPR